MPTSPFLDSLTFLSDAQRITLRAEDLDTAIAFKHVTMADLKGEPFKLTTGKASQLLDAAHSASPSAIPSPHAVTVAILPEPSKAERLCAALAAAVADPSKAVDLADLGCAQVVIGAEGQVDGPATLALWKHIDTGASVGVTWKGQRIADVRKLSTPTLYCSPRTGKALQDGCDPDDEDVQWGDLDLAGLRVAAFGYQRGMFIGMTDIAVLAAFKNITPILRHKAERRAKNEGVDLADMDTVVVFSPRARPTSPQFERSIQGAPPRATGNKAGDLSALFVRLFSEGELRRFLGNGPEGDRIIGALPGTGVSMATLAHAAADVLVRWGHVSDLEMRRMLRDRLVAERPRRVDEIDSLLGR